MADLTLKVIDESFRKGFDYIIEFDDKIFVCGYNSNNLKSNNESTDSGVYYIDFNNEEPSLIPVEINKKLYDSYIYGLPLLSKDRIGKLHFIHMNVYNDRLYLCDFNKNGVWYIDKANDQSKTNYILNPIMDIDGRPFINGSFSKSEIYGKENGNERIIFFPESGVHGLYSLNNFNSIYKLDVINNGRFYPIITKNDGSLFNLISSKNDDLYGLYYINDDFSNLYQIYSFTTYNGVVRKINSSFNGALNDKDNNTLYLLSSTNTGIWKIINDESQKIEITNIQYGTFTDAVIYNDIKYFSSWDGIFYENENNIIEELKIIADNEEKHLHINKIKPSNELEENPNNSMLLLTTGDGLYKLTPSDDPSKSIVDKYDITFIKDNSYVTIAPSFTDIYYYSNKNIMLFTTPTGIFYKII